MASRAAQHLLSALARREYQYATGAWSLGPIRTTVDFERRSIPSEHLVRLEDLANAAVRANHRVFATWHEPGAPELDAVSSRGVADYAVGPVRVVRIDSLDDNTCSGTHVSHTSELQLIKILGSENVTAGTRVTFVAGMRALRLFSELHSMDRTLARMLSTRTATESVERVGALLQVQARADKSRRSMLRELARCTADLLGVRLSTVAAADNSALVLLHAHCDDGDAEYLNALAKQVPERCPDGRPVLGFYTAADADTGAYLLMGPAEVVATAAPLVADAVGGKAGGRPGRIQGKAQSLGAEQRARATDALRRGLGTTALCSGI